MGAGTVISAFFVRKMMSNFEQNPDDALQGSHINTHIFNEKCTMVTQPNGFKSFIHQFEKWDIHPEDVFGNCLPTKSRVSSPETKYVPSHGPYGQVGATTLAIQEFACAGN